MPYTCIIHIFHHLNFNQMKKFQKFQLSKKEMSKVVGGGSPSASLQESECLTSYEIGQYQTIGRLEGLGEMEVHRDSSGCAHTITFGGSSMDSSSNPD